MRILIGLAVLLAGAGSAFAKDCPMPSVPEGVRVQRPAGCEQPVRSGAGRSAPSDSVKAERGFIDLGNGTKVRIGGQVRVDTKFGN